MTFSLVWLAEVLEGAELKVAEIPGWRSRGRAEMGQVRGVMCHHTAGAASGNMPSLRIITEGRPDLPGPLAQLGLGRDGTRYVVAAGRANHAGAGNWQGVTSGNSSFIGVEAENSGGANDPWPAVQIDAYIRGVAAILRKLGKDSIMCCGHKEYALPSGRKPDPRFDMNDFRFKVAAVMNGNAPLPSRIPLFDVDERPTLRRGSRGEPVIALQQKIGDVTTGTFSAITEAKLRSFQRSHGLVPDGIAGPRTWATLLA